mmetsp:Transcript_24110/g.75602  ORF Transcript_24110/g.75602 Transcript_24110/m.75602 type:complete len:201 (-) Transcript_24110:20-622(-)
MVGIQEEELARCQAAVHAATGVPLVAHGLDLYDLLHFHPAGLKVDGLVALLHSPEEDVPGARGAQHIGVERVERYLGDVRLRRALHDDGGVGPVPNDDLAVGLAARAGQPLTIPREGNGTKLELGSALEDGQELEVARPVHVNLRLDALLVVGNQTFVPVAGEPSNATPSTEQEPLRRTSAELAPIVRGPGVWVDRGGRQ